MLRKDPEPGVIYIGIGTPFREEDAGIKPVPLDMAPDVQGIYVGGCVSDGPSVIDHGADAHAHTDKGDAHYGWVCFQHPDDVNDKSLRMHELAHIRTGEGHTAKWRAEMVRLGEVIPHRYRRREKQRCS